MSHCTLHEKLDLLYDMINWSNGLQDGITLCEASEMIKTIFERCLYFWPSHQLYNQIDASFNKTVSAIYRAFWTSDVTKLRDDNSKYYMSLKDLLSGTAGTSAEQMTSIEVTDEIQQTFTQYFTLFGSKTIDFNQDVTPYRNIKDLIGKDKGNKLLAATKSASKTYSLVLFVHTQDQRFPFTLKFNNQDGSLIPDHTPSSQMMPAQGTKEAFANYFGRMKNCLDLSGGNRRISKSEFMETVEKIPMLANLIRAETLYRD